MSAARLALLAGLCAVAGAAHAQVVINEVYANPPTSAGDDNWEYVEIYGPAGMSLNGWALAAISGGQDPDGNGIPGGLGTVGDPGEELPEIDEAWTLDGLSIGSNGMLVIYNGAGTATNRQVNLIPAATTKRSFVASHIPTVDTAGKIINDGSVTYTLVRRRPFHTLNTSGASLYDGVATPTLADYAAGNRYAFRKDSGCDVDFDGRWDLNGIATFDVGGGVVAPETSITSEDGITADPVGFSEPVQVVDDLAVSNAGGKEYARSKQQEISDTPGYNPDAASRVFYFGANPARGWRFVAGEMVPTRTADEEFIYGDIINLTNNDYNATNSGGPTDQNGPTYNASGALDPAGTFLMNDINRTGFNITPGSFNDVNSISGGGANIAQFRFVRGDFNFDGVVDCADKALIVQAAAEGWTLDDTKVVVKDRDTVDPADDITYTTYKWEGRAFNGVLAMIRMNLSDGSTGEWTCGKVFQGGQIVAWGGAVTQSDLDAFNAEFALECLVVPTCAACAADFDDNGGIDGADLAAFFSAYEAGEACGDVDNNGGIDGADLAYFFGVYEAGGC